MRKLLVVLLVLMVLYVLAELGSRPFIDGAAESAIEANGFVQVGDAEVSASGFPLLARLALSGSVPELDVAVTDAEASGVTLQRVDMRIEGLELDRDRLLGGTLIVKDVDLVEITARLTDLAVSEALGREVRFEGGSVVVDVGGTSVATTISIVDENLMVEIPGEGPAQIRLPSGYLPCDPIIEMGEGVAEASCTSDHLPPALAGWLADPADVEQDVELEPPITIEQGG